MDKKRHSFSLRLQPMNGTPLAEVVDWLNALGAQEKKELIGDILTMTCLALARAEAGEPREQVESCYWKTNERLENFQFTLGLRLRINFVPYKPNCSLTALAESLNQFNRLSVPQQEQQSWHKRDEELEEQANTFEIEEEPGVKTCLPNCVSTMEIDDLFD